MYHKILVPLENTAADQTILNHVRRLAKMTGARLLFLHVADGWVARNYEQLKLAESEEIKQDRAYLEKRVKEFKGKGFRASAILGMGEPPDEIVRVALEQKVDLIAMSTHGHRFISDVLYGNTADKVRHLVNIPVLLLKVKK
ncbi:MAG: universal stress protein [Methylacidiphilales bacterium]|nr:universal stress protein [Candidatus Methylacidiphilales bacterium]